MVLADRGFIIEDLLNKKRADLNIPPFLRGRGRLTPQEEMGTKINANARIHVERAIERPKKSTLLTKTISLSLGPTIIKNKFHFVTYFIYCLHFFLESYIYIYFFSFITRIFMCD